MGKGSGYLTIKVQAIVQSRSLAWSLSLLQCKKIVCEKLCTWVEAVLEMVAVEGATDSLSWWRSGCW